MHQEITYISLFELQNHIRQALQDAFRQTYWVAAEISEMKVNNSGHCYLELVEKGGRNHVPKAKVSAAIWRNKYGFLSEYFLQQTGSPLDAGMKVLLKVEISYHELYGLSLVVQDIDPTYTLGDMERQKQETIRLLQAEGVFDMNRELEFPRVMQRLAIISSDKAAGYRDFCMEIEQNPFGYRFSMTLFQAVMQGKECEQSVIQALDAVADCYESFDAVILIRGGGSQSDLGTFHSYRLCSHIAQFPLPVITGIGHDKDTSVADMVAAVALKTPTAVARHLIDCMQRFETGLGEVLNRIVQQYEKKYTFEKTRLRNLGHEISTGIRSTVRQADRRIDSYGIDLVRLSQISVNAGKNRLWDFSQKLKTGSRQQVQGKDVLLSSLTQRLTSATQQLLAVQNAHLELMAAKTEGKDPQQILNMGYSLVKYQGKIIRTVDAIPVGATVDIRLSDGSLSSTITSKKALPKK